MNIKEGIIISSTAALSGTNFEKAIIFITEYNAEGAMGFVLNKLFERSLNELEEFKNSVRFSLHDGGPVDHQHLFFIHQRDDIITGGRQINDSVYLGGDFKQAVEGINSRQISTNVIKIFIGYCGWDAGELEAEIEEGSWQIIEGNDPFQY